MSRACTDDPNRQSLGLDPAWVEGTGGEGGEPSAAAEGNDKSKDELLEYARQIGASPANNAMTKEELQASIDEAEGR